MNISVVIPLLNEQESLNELYDWIANVVQSNHFSYEIIFIDDASNDDEDDNNVVDWIESQEEENVDYENDMNELNYEREFWKTEVLRKTTMHPEDVIGGLVFFEKDLYAEYFKIFINVNSSKFEFLYQQKKIKRIAKAR